MKDEGIFESCLGMIVSLVVLVIIATLANGWALVTIWNWFIPPIFGLTSLTLWQAMGVSMVFNLFVGVKNQSSNSDTKNKTYGEVFVTSLLTIILTPLFTVAFAYIVLQLAF
jgi:hypothetical protein